MEYFREITFRLNLGCKNSVAMVVNFDIAIGVATEFGNSSPQCLLKGDVIHPPQRKVRNENILNEQRNYKERIPSRLRKLG
jgi:hypothetical protein